MTITYKKRVEDPPYPIMEGKKPLAIEFNKRQKDLWAKGNVEKVDYEYITTVLLEILVEDYDRRHAPRKNKKK